MGPILLVTRSVWIQPYFRFQTQTPPQVISGVDPLEIPGLSMCFTLLYRRHCHSDIDPKTPQCGYIYVSMPLAPEWPLFLEPKHRQFLLKRRVKRGFYRWQSHLVLSNPPLPTLLKISVSSRTTCCGLIGSKQLGAASVPMKQCLRRTVSGVNEDPVTDLTGCRRDPAAQRLNTGLKRF